ncbi:MAG: cytochrome c peroxidase [Saprospiraceae bacterium]|nr:cytochrome c peroxidase [Saprospiraceae bacterium]
MRAKIWHIALLCFLAFSCTEEEMEQSIADLALMDVPPAFLEIVHPEGNEYSFERWSLGKKLFFDPILSKDGKVSCASCHDPSLAFSDKQEVSLGSDGLSGTRNSPTLVNVAYHPYFTREGGVPTLEMQVLVPIQEHNEFNNNIVLIADTLSKIETYVSMAQEAYGQEPNSFVITRALAQFERSLISGQSLYDQQYNYGFAGSMSVSAKRGKLLFESDRTSCTSCHSGFNFTDYSFQNNGLYEEYDDPGRSRFTQKEEDIALFKVPSLRNIEVTAPYMHDGSLASLEEVIDHYDSGGAVHINKSERIKPLNLSNSEKEDLLAFLKSLTDQKFINNKNFQE